MVVNRPWELRLGGRWLVKGQSIPVQLLCHILSWADLSSSSWVCRGQSCAEHTQLWEALATSAGSNIPVSRSLHSQKCSLSGSGSVSLFLTPTRTQEDSQGRLDDPGHHPPRSLPCSRKGGLVRIMFAR